MKYKRQLVEQIQKSKKSLLLLGPRQTGKSTLLKSLKPDLSINFAREQTFLEFSSQPDLLEKIIAKEKPRTIFLDEIQRLPSLLNTVQYLIDENPNRFRFLLSGSSARKLKRGQANLLPGRLLTYRLGSLTYLELGRDFQLEEALTYGTLPGIWMENDKATRKQILRSYASTYLKEEVQAEALTKNIEGFSRFLMIAASKSGEFLDYAKIGSLASITQKTSTRFMEVLEDTLIVRKLEAFAKNSTRRLIQHPKFYFFDNGVLNGLLGGFSAPADRKGFIFEHFIINQIFVLNSLSGDNARLSTYRTEAGSEVDLILEKAGEVLCVEIKSSLRLNKKDFFGLKRFAEFHGGKVRCILLYAGTRAYGEESIEVLPWRTALDEINAFLA